MAWGMSGTAIRDAGNRAMELSHLVDLGKGCHGFEMYEISNGALIWIMSSIDRAVLLKVRQSGKETEILLNERDFAEFVAEINKIALYSRPTTDFYDGWEACLRFSRSRPALPTTAA
jgi:hypothetical protein